MMKWEAISLHPTTQFHILDFFTILFDSIPHFTKLNSTLTESLPQCAGHLPAFQCL